MAQTVRYEWRATPGWHFTGDANEIGGHVEKLAEERDGFLTTKDIVNDARNPHSLLHPQFEWNDQVAAEKWRESTARALVGSLYSVRVEQSAQGDKEVRAKAFINVVVEGRHFYSPVENVVKIASLHDQYLQSLLTEAILWRRKAEGFQEFSTVVQAIDSLPLARLLQEEEA